MQQVRVDIIASDGATTSRGMTAADFSAQLHLEFLRTGSVKLLDFDDARLVFICGNLRFVAVGLMSYMQPIIRSIRFFLAPEQVLNEIPMPMSLRDELLRDIAKGDGRTKYGFLLGCGLGSYGDFAEAVDLSTRDLIALVRLQQESLGLTLSEIQIYRRFAA